MMVRMHVAAFNWWRREPREGGAPLRLAALLQRLDLERADKEWIAQVMLGALEAGYGKPASVEKPKRPRYTATVTPTKTKSRRGDGGVETPAEPLPW
jgi:hypothetical protein